MNDLELGWLAGIFEGEGTCGVWGPYANGRVITMLIVYSTDLDVLERIQELTKCGSIMNTGNPKGENKQLLRWQVANRSDMLRVCELIYPLLHSRRQVQMQPVISQCKEMIKRAICRHGLSSCHECKLERRRLRYAQRKVSR